MGRTSKPLCIHIDKTLYMANESHWLSLREQGHDIVVVEGGLPDLYLAPYAMRMTPDMLTQLPSAFDLAVKGARALRHAPQTKEELAWKGKHAKGKVTHKRKNTKIKTKAVDRGEPTPQAEDQGVGGSTGIPASESPHDERII